MKRLLTLSLLLTAVTVQASSTCHKNWFSCLTTKVTSMVSHIFGKKQKEPVGAERLVLTDEEGNPVDYEMD